jgi:uncharacterized spore protein YtfJ
MEHRSGELVGRIAGALRGALRAETVYGAPVERDGVTVIPVARARLGFGGGAGGEGGGGGGGGTVSPVGYIELRADGSTRFRRIVTAQDIGVALAGLAAAALVLRRR